MNDDFIHIPFFNYDKNNDINIPYKKNKNSKKSISKKDNNILQFIFLIDNDNSLLSTSKKNAENIIFSNNFYLRQYLYYISKDYFMNTLKKSFKNKNDIKQQFINDLSRSKYYINGYKIKNFDHCFYYLNTCFQKKYIYDIFMIANQASLSFPTIYLYKNFENLGYNIGNIDYHKKLTNNLIIKISINKKEIKFWIYKNLRIYQVLNNNIKNIAFVSIIMDFNLLKDDYFECSIKFIK